MGLMESMAVTLVVGRGDAIGASPPVRSALGLLFFLLLLSCAGLVRSGRRSIHAAFMQHSSREPRDAARAWPACALPARCLGAACASSRRGSRQQARGCAPHSIFRLDSVNPKRVKRDGAKLSCFASHPALHGLHGLHEWRRAGPGQAWQAGAAAKPWCSGTPVQAVQSSRAETLRRWRRCGAAAHRRREKGTPGQARPVLYTPWRREARRGERRQSLLRPAPAGSGRLGQAWHPAGMPRLAHGWTYP